MAMASVPPAASPLSLRLCLRSAQGGASILSPGGGEEEENRPRRPSLPRRRTGGRPLSQSLWTVWTTP